MLLPMCVIARVQDGIFYKPLKHPDKTKALKMFALSEYNSVCLLLHPVSDADCDVEAG
jgi:hypothetical protein